MESEHGAAGEPPVAGTVSANPPAPVGHRNEIRVALANALRLGGSLILTWSVALIVKLQIPAHLGPVRQGRFAFAESFALIFFSAIGLGIEIHTTKEVSVRPSYASEFIGGIFALRAIMALGLLAIMATTLSVTGRTDEILAAALVFGVAQLFFSFNQTLASVLQAVSKVGRLAIANVGSKVVWGGGILLGLAFDAPLWLLAVPMVASEALKAAVLVPTAAAVAQLRFRIEPRAVKYALIASFPFFVNAMAVTFGNSLAVNALEFTRRDPREVGWFSASQNIASLAVLLQPILSWVVMPMLARAQARSTEEMLNIVKRTIEVLLVIITPGTVILAASSDILIDLAFGPSFAPATIGLSVQAPVFVMMYMNVMLSAALINMERGWTVTLISIGAVFTQATLMFVMVPLGRHFIGVGGECAGAAIAVVASEACVVIAMTSRFEKSPLDRRNLTVLAKSVVASAITLGLNHYILHWGAPRMLVVTATYIVLALLLRIVRPSEVADLVRVVKAERGR